MPITQDNDLRLLQECDVLLLQIFHSLCERYQLTYWLDYGTLLGAIRHKGFIPWDDDMDIAMPRDDYNKVLHILEKELGPLGFRASEPKPGRKIGLGYKHKETGIWLDIFPVDSLFTSKTLPEIEDDLKHNIVRYQHKYNKKAKKRDALFWASLRQLLINDQFQHGNNQTFYHGPEFQYSKILIHPATDILPLRLCTFENIHFYTPNRSNNYLQKLYGTHYMQFPKNGILKHDLGRGPLSTWAKKYGTDMHQIKEYLISIENNFKTY